MPGWTNNELEAIDAAEELDLASVRRDGTLRRPVTMWSSAAATTCTSAPVTDAASWFCGARNRHEARIRTGGIEKHVSLLETDSLNDPAAIAHGPECQCVRCTGFQPRKRLFF